MALFDHYDLYAACMSGDLDVVKSLYEEFHFDPGMFHERFDHKNTFWTPVKAAILNGHLNVVKFMASIPGSNIAGVTVLTYALMRGDVDMVRFIWEQCSTDAEFNRMIRGDGIQRLIFKEAMKSKKSAGLKFLVSIPSMLRILADRETLKSAVEEAIRYDSSDTLKVLFGVGELSRGLEEIAGEICLIEMAIGDKSLDVLKLLLTYPATSPLGRVAPGKGHLNYICEHGSVPMLRVMVSDARFDINELAGGQTPLTTASKIQCKQRIGVLLSSPGIKPDACNAKGRTPISILVRRRAYHTTKTFLALAPRVRVGGAILRHMDGIVSADWDFLEDYRKDPAGTKWKLQSELYPKECAAERVFALMFFSNFLGHMALKSEQ